MERDISKGQTGADPEMERLLTEYGRRVRFKEQLKSTAGAHQRMEIHTFHQESMEKKSRKNKNKQLWNRIIISTVAAAAIAIMTAFGTLWLSGYYRTMEKNSSNYRELRRDMNTVKRDVSKQNMVLRDISGNVIGGDPASINNYGATGFLISTDGYVVTNHHVVNGADSVHLQNAKGESYQARVIYMDSHSDLAILKINDSTFQAMKTIPYAFKEQASELGEDVFTLGFPRDESVYGQGYLSSMSGYSGDTSAYQISIPLNPGNSGGPLLDSRGNIIGIISGKQAGSDGTAFAIKTKILSETLEQIPADSLDNPLLLPKKRSQLAGLPRTEQIKRIQDYVYIVKVY